MHTGFFKAAATGSFNEDVRAKRLARDAKPFLDLHGSIRSNWARTIDEGPGCRLSNAKGTSKLYLGDALDLAIPFQGFAALFLFSH